MKNLILILVLFFTSFASGQQNTTKEQDSIQEANINPSEIPVNKKPSINNQQSSGIYTSNSYIFPIDLKQQKMDSLWYSYHILTYREVGKYQEELSSGTFSKLPKIEIDSKTGKEVELLIALRLPNLNNGTIEVITHGHNIYLFEFKGFKDAKLLSVKPIKVK